MDYTILLANQLGRVITIKEAHEKEVNVYRELARENGVSKETIDYILQHPTGGMYE